MTDQPCRWCKGSRTIIGFAMGAWPCLECQDPPTNRPTDTDLPSWCTVEGLLPHWGGQEFGVHMERAGIPTRFWGIVWGRASDNPDTESPEDHCTWLAGVLTEAWRLEQ